MVVGYVSQQPFENFPTRGMVCFCPGRNLVFPELATDRTNVEASKYHDSDSPSHMYYFSPSIKMFLKVYLRKSCRIDNCLVLLAMQVFRGQVHFQGPPTLKDYTY